MTPTEPWHARVWDPGSGVTVLHASGRTRVLRLEATGLDGGKVSVGLTRISPDGQQTPFSRDLKKTLERTDDGVFGLATGPNGSVYVSTWDAVLRVNHDGTVTTVVHHDCIGIRRKIYLPGEILIMY